MLELLKDIFTRRFWSMTYTAVLVWSWSRPFFTLLPFNDAILKIIANNVHIWSSLAIYKELDSALRLIRIVVRMLIWLEIQSTPSLRRTIGTGPKWPCVLERCPSYKQSNRERKERQGPTLGVRFTGVSVKRESTVLKAIEAKSQF